MTRVIRSQPNARLYFMGGRHPNPAVPDMEMASRAKKTAEELGLLNEYVFFNEGWVPYEERADYLLEADVAVSAHQAHAETRFAFRTRLLDCVWAGLPMVVTAGDALADLVRSHDLGRIVEPGDLDGMTESLLDLLQLPPVDTGRKHGFEKVRSQLTWERAARPLVRFCLRPHPAIDRAVRSLEMPYPSLKMPYPWVSSEPTPLLRLPGRALAVLRQQGWRTLLSRAGRHFRWRVLRRSR
jgi:hypothetical protein